MVPRTRARRCKSEWIKQRNTSTRKNWQRNTGMGNLHEQTGISHDANISTKQETVTSGRTRMGNKARAMGNWKRNMPTRQGIQKAELQQEISRRNQKLRRQGKFTRLQQILQAWQRAAQYTNKHAAEIQYARRPVIDITKDQTRRERPRAHKQASKANPRICRLGRRKTLPPNTDTHSHWRAQESTNQELYLHRKGWETTRQKFGLAWALNIIQERWKTGKYKRKHTDYKKKPTRTICIRYGTSIADSARIILPVILQSRRQMQQNATEWKRRWQGGKAGYRNDSSRTKTN